MLCTASVEEVIDEHYQNQINQLGLMKKFKKKIIKFREDNTSQGYSLRKRQQKKGFIQLWIKLLNRIKVRNFTKKI